MGTNRKPAGLAVCVLIAAWTAFTGLSHRMDSRIDDAASEAARLESRVGDVEDQVGNPSYGSSQSSRLEALEAHARNAEERADVLERKLRDMEYQRATATR